MRIAMWVSNTYTTPPPRKVIRAPQLIALEIANNLVKGGHRVTLFAAKGSRTLAHLETAGLSALSGKPFDFSSRSNSELAIAHEMALTSRMFQLALQDKFDIIHSHSTLRVIHFSQLVKIPIVYTLHIPINFQKEKDVEAEKRVFYEKFILDYYKTTKNNFFIAISESQKRSFPELNWAGVIHHGINVKNFDFSARSGKYLFAAGRIIPEKGFDVAIQVSKKLGVPLIISGDYPKDYPHYWQTKIKPEIDNKQIKFVGMLDGKRYTKLLGGAKAFLMPIRWPEPFGLVMIEAMACGTPVIAFNQGSVPEVVKDGKTGFIIKPHDFKGMVEAVKNIDKIKRQACRQHVEKYFTAEKMAEKYEKIFQVIISECKK